MRPTRPQGGWAAGPRGEGNEATGGHAATGHVFNVATNWPCHTGHRACTSSWALSFYINLNLAIEN